MALWTKVKQLDHQSLEEIRSFYSNKNIPIEVRDSCSGWIEDSINKLAPLEFVKGLDNEIHCKLLPLTNSPTHQPLLSMPFYVVNALNQFQTTLTILKPDMAQDLYNTFLSCLEMETFIVNRNNNYVKPLQQHSSGVVEAVAEMHPLASVNKTLSYVPAYQNQYKCGDTKTVINKEMETIVRISWELEEASNMFFTKRHELLRYQDETNQVALDQRKPINGMHQIYENAQELLGRMNELRNEIIEIATLIHSKVKDTQNSVKVVIEKWKILKAELDVDLIQWTQQQKMFANGATKAMTLLDLDHSQYLAEYLMDIVWKLRKCLQTAKTIYEANLAVFNNQNFNTGNTAVGPEIPEQLFTVTQLITQLVQDTFIVAHQPMQVVKTNTKFPIPDERSPTEIRLLVGGKLSLHLITPDVQVVLIDEKTAKTIETNGLSGTGFQKKFQNPGKINPGNKRFPAFSETSYSSVVFKDLQINNFSRDGRENIGRGQQMKFVTEEKLCLLFRSEFSVDGINFQVWRKSLPIAVCTHVSQDSSAWGAITWDNFFSVAGRQGFEVEEYVSWDNFKKLLISKFTAMTGTQLPEDNLEYIAEKLSTLEGFPNMLSRLSLCHDVYPGNKDFSFWDWFYEGTKLIQKHFKQALTSGFVRGFVKKETYEKILCNSGCYPGTFLFRLSDSVCGGMSIMWLHSDGKVYSQAPFTYKDLSCQPLVDKLNQENLLYVFPNIKKEEGLKDIYEQHKKRTEKEKITKPGYVQLETRLSISRISNPDIPNFDKASSTRQAERPSFEPNSNPDAVSPSAAVSFGEHTGAEGMDTNLDDLLNDLMFPLSSGYMNHSNSPSQISSPGSSNGCYMEQRQGSTEQQRNGWASVPQGNSGEKTFYMQI